MENKGNGYDGYSMSNNARLAYANGEMPLSKWTKTLLLEALEEIEGLDMVEVRKIPVAVLREAMLTQTSWHHTSKYFNVTNFYALDLDGLTMERLNFYLDIHRRELKRTKDVRKNKTQVDEMQKAAKRQEKALREECQSLLAYSTYKTVTGLVNAVNNNKVNLEQLKTKREQDEHEKRMKSLKSELGQLRKYTDFSNTNEMLQSYLTSQLDLEPIRRLYIEDINYKYGYEVYIKGKMPSVYPC